MTVYVTGDVHGRAEYGSSRFTSKSWPLGRTLTRDDAVIVAGNRQVERELAAYKREEQSQ